MRTFSLHLHLSRPTSCFPVLCRAFLFRSDFGFLCQTSHLKQQQIFHSQFKSDAAQAMFSNIKISASGKKESNSSFGVILSGDGIDSSFSYTSFLILSNFFCRLEHLNEVLIWYKIWVSGLLIARPNKSVELTQVANSKPGFTVL